jgi:hypothetical protein
LDRLERAALLYLDVFEELGLELFETRCHRESIAHRYCAT